jgi:hypothetical protein
MPAPEIRCCAGSRKSRRAFKGLVLPASDRALGIGAAVIAVIGRSIESWQSGLLACRQPHRPETAGTYHNRPCTLGFHATLPCRQYGSMGAACLSGTARMGCYLRDCSLDLAARFSSACARPSNHSAAYSVWSERGAAPRLHALPGRSVGRPVFGHLSR